MLLEEADKYWERINTINFLQTKKTSFKKQIAAWLLSKTEAPSSFYPMLLMK